MITGNYVIMIAYAQYRFRFILPIILAILIGIIVSFAVQGFISFVSFFNLI